MNTKQNLWIQAEEDFHKWIEVPELYPVNEYTNRRKSIHIFFRRKYHNLLTPILKKAYEGIHPEISLHEEDSLIEHELFSEPEGIHYSREIGISSSWTREDENKRILDGFWKDDYKTIADFYKTEFSKVALMILRNSGTIDDARDLFQDAMVILMDKYTWGKLDLINCSLGTYVYSLSRNLWYSRLRTMNKEIEFIDLEQQHYFDISTDYYAEEPDDFEKVNTAISSLGNPCKELLELFYFENHSWETIALAMGYSSPASARNQKYKCLEKIRKHLASEP